MSDALHTVNWRHIKQVNRKKEVKNLNSICYVANPFAFSSKERFVKHLCRLKRDEQLKREASQMPDRWYALIDTPSRKKIKHSAMNSREASRRNYSIKDLGMQWVLCEK